MNVPIPKGMHTILNIRQLDLHSADCFRRGALSRQLTQADYLARLIGLHIAVRVKADAGDPAAQELLKAVSLETVSA